MCAVSYICLYLSFILGLLLPNPIVCHYREGAGVIPAVSRQGQGRTLKVKCGNHIFQSVNYWWFVAFNLQLGGPTWPGAANTPGPPLLEQGVIESHYWFWKNRQINKKENALKHERKRERRLQPQPQQHQQHQQHGLRHRRSNVRREEEKRGEGGCVTNKTDIPVVACAHARCRHRGNHCRAASQRSLH